MAQREALYENIFEFARSASRDLKTLEDFNQPLIEVERIPQAHNCLTLMQGPPDKGDVPAKCTFAAENVTRRPHKLI